MIIISAMTEDRVIGKDNTLPWDIPEELEHFRKATAGATVIMGRRTYESIGRPMDGRVNIVLSRSGEPISGVIVERSLPRALWKAEGFGREIFVLGGSEVFREAIPLADKMYLSFIKKKYLGDTFFPQFNEDEWTITVEEDRGSYVYRTFERKKPMDHAE